MATAARDTSQFISNQLTAKSIDGHFTEDVSTAFSSFPNVGNWVNSDRVFSYPLMPVISMVDAVTVYSNYFYATRPCEIGAVIFPLEPDGSVPAGISALTAEIRVVKDGAAEVSAMYNDTAISIVAEDTTRVLSCEHDDTIADADRYDQLWCLKAGDLVRIKFVSTGTGTIVPASLVGQLIIREL